MQSNQQKDDLTVRQRELAYAQDLRDKGDFEQAYEIAYRWLKFDPEDPAALTILVAVLIDTDKVAIAHSLAKRVCDIAPEKSVGWMNLGRAASDLWRYNESRRAYKKAYGLAQDDKTKSAICVNIASMMVDHGQFQEAEKWCRKAITYNPDTTKGKANLGFCQLAQRDWSEGWRNYRQCIGQNGRYYAQYNNEPLWDGESQGTILLYGEQGLGDEVSFSQMIPDAQRWCDKNNSRLIVDLNHRLEALIQRSFPETEIHGSRSQKYCDFDASVVDYSLPIAQAGEYFRYKDEQFTGKPYLKPDPDRVLQWKALFERKKKPVIGIGWQGGTWKTATKFRQLSLEQLLPVLKSVDAHWVSLQYKASGDQIEAFKKDHDIDIVEYPYGTLSNDYDDTVAMIAAMDMIVTMQTTTVHVAGGLGIPCWAFVPRTSQWRYGQDGEDFPWAKSVRIIRQVTDGVWDDVMEKTGEELANYSRVSKTAAVNARKQEDKLRHDGRKVRSKRKPDDRRDGSGRDSGLRRRPQHESEGHPQA